MEHRMRFKSSEVNLTSESNVTTRRNIKYFSKEKVSYDIRLSYRSPNEIQEVKTQIDVGVKSDHQKKPQVFDKQ